MYKLLKVPEYAIMLKENISVLIIGNVVAFIVAIGAIKFFIDFLTRHGFKAFGWYRIVVGLILIVLLSTGTVSNII